MAVGMHFHLRLSFEGISVDTRAKSKVRTEANYCEPQLKKPERPKAMLAANRTVLQSRRSPDQIQTYPRRPWPPSLSRPQLTA